MDERELHKIKATLTIISPFLVSLLRAAKIILTEELNADSGVDNRGYLIINPKRFSELPFEEKLTTISHEVLHIAFRDAPRIKRESPKLWNFVADAVNNNLLDTLIKCQPSFVSMIDLENLYHFLNLKIPSNLYSRSKERIFKDIYSTIKHRCKQRACLRCGGKKLSIKPRCFGIIEISCDQCGCTWTEAYYRRETDYKGDLYDRKFDGQVIQEGNPEAYKERGWEKELAKAMITQKTVGKLPAGLKRMVDKILKPKISFGSLLREAIWYGIGKTRVSSWRRLSRRHPQLPGFHQFDKPKIFCGIDTSGSIEQEELREFVSIVHGFVKLGYITYVRSWDGQAYPEAKLTSPSETVKKLNEVMKGWGGTVLYPYLSIIQEKCRNQIVTILTDGEIWDIKEPKTRQLLKEIGQRALVAIFVYTSKEPKNLKNWRVIELSL